MYVLNLRLVSNFCFLSGDRFYFIIDKREKFPVKEVSSYVYYYNKTEAFLKKGPLSPFMLII
ncbi:hypothetical protein OSO01_03590 [Oceanobacillus sojae]|uniref:Uncharacterized protein n=1 Tax=Oceanobacillus sojae TaxID=582851 RepID=A0A511ZDW3_9BACI|nr:hypothetical protein OSO01_03590 [Oceanobacillus sojae]